MKPRQPPRKGDKVPIPAPSNRGKMRECSTCRLLSPSPLLVKKGHDEGETWFLHELEMPGMRPALPEGSDPRLRVLLRSAGGGLRLRPDPAAHQPRENPGAPDQHVAVPGVTAD